MKKIIAMCLLLTGCAGISLDSPVKDPKTGELIPCHVTYLSFLKSHEEIGGGACGGTAGATGSKVDAEAIGAVAGAAIGAYKKIQGIP